MLKHMDLWETHFPQFYQAGQPLVSAIMETAKLVKLSAKQHVFYPGSQCDHYLLLIEGGVKAQLIAESGREMLLYHVHPGDSCILTTSCLLSGEHYPAEGIVETDISAFAIPTHAFYRGLEQSGFFREFVFKNFATRLANVMRRMESVAFNSIEARLSQLLLNFNASSFNVTHQELAAELGSAREVVSRQLKRFEVYGWIRLNRGTIEIINPAALKQLGKLP